jgi:NADPH:quinone reductase
MVKAVIGSAFGPPESYELGDIDLPPPDVDEVRVRIVAAGVSFVDVLTARGQYQFKPELPFIPGSEFSGVVAELGEGVRNLTVGDRVFGSSLGGVFAQAGNFKAANLSILPDGMSMEQASVFPVSYQSVWHGLVDRGHLATGETLLVLGAGGAAGYAAVELGKYLGARVIASASSPEKRAVAMQGGADVAVDARCPDWREQVKAANGGRAIDVVFDPVGGDATELAFRTLGYGGRLLVFGFPAGIPAVKTNLALLKSASIIGVHMRHFSMEYPEKAEANRLQLLALAGQGLLKPAIAQCFDLGDYVAAMAAAWAGQAAGRVVMRMGH